MSTVTALKNILENAIDDKDAAINWLEDLRLQNDTLKAFDENIFNDLIDCLIKVIHSDEPEEALSAPVDAKPLLSICVPTYNRAEYLNKSIASLVSQKEFYGGNVELIISDNASTDNTGEVVAKYQKIYKNIVYSRNDENIHDMNFPTAIGKARGLYRKLCNDTMFYKDNCLKEMLNIINDNIENKPVIYFLVLMNPKNNKENYSINGLDAFLRIVSVWATWIGSFGIWEEDYEKIENKFEGCDLKLWQVKVMLEVIARKKNCYIENRRLFENHGISRDKGDVKDMSYKIYNVFHNNYFGLFQQYLITGAINKKTFELQKRFVLFDTFLPWLITFYYHPTTHKLSPEENIRKKVFHSYWHKKYYLHFLLLLNTNTRFKKISSIFTFFKRIIKFFLPHGFIKLWKQRKKLMDFFRIAMN